MNYGNSVLNCIGTFLKVHCWYIPGKLIARVFVIADLLLVKYLRPKL